MMDVEMFSVVGYEVVGLIGQGGIGDVYRARQLSTGAVVAIKVLRDFDDDPASLHRLHRELEALTALGGQSHVVRLIDVVDSESGPALVMEYAPGGSVANLVIERGTPLDTAEVVLIGEHTASALAAAHRLGIVHRDVKPQNLLIDAYGAVKLCDFGVAALTRSERFHTRTTALSVRYASPEDLEQDAQVGGPSDVYSLGATLLHLAHGAPPTLRERVQAWAPPGRDDPSDSELDAVIAACLQPDPDRRPSAEYVAEQLECIAATMTPRARALRSPAADTSLDGPHIDEPQQGWAHADDSPEPNSVRAIQSVVEVKDTSSDGRLVSDSLSDPTSPLDGVPRPVHRAVSRKGSVVRAALVGVLVIAVIAIVRLMFDGGGDERQVAPTRSVVPRSAGVASVFLVRLPVVERGDCLGVEPGGVAAAVVPCDEVHDAEVIAVDRVPADDTATFDAAAVDAAARAFCATVGTPPLSGDLSVLVISPSQSTWANGDRRMLCLVASPTGRIAGHG